MDFLKYYFLEDYLLKEVRKNFMQRHFLTPEEFFCVIIWKSNRAKTAIKNKLLKRGPLDVVIKDMTEQLFKAFKHRERLRILLRDWKFNLPMATAILTILYPEDFTVYDKRVRLQLEQEEIYGIKRYFEKFLPAVQRVKTEKNLRDKDRFLWGKSFYEDLKKFLRK